MKFKVGEIYKDREGREYKLLMYVPEASNDNKMLFLQIDSGIVLKCNTAGISSIHEKHDILPPEKKTVKLYPALRKTVDGKRYYADYFYETCPPDAIRLITEYPPVIIEVDDD